jgi:predicted amidophosphoribosyltransferase
MSTIKCPNCKAELNTLTTICEWCGFVINKKGEDSIEDITTKLRGIVLEGRKLPQQGLFSSFRNNAKISMPIFAVASFVLAYKINFIFLILGLFFTLYAILTIFKKRLNISDDLQNIQANFDIEVQRLDNLYGQDNFVATQIQQFKTEMININKNGKRSKIAEWVSYAIIITIFTVVILLPAPKSNAEIKNELFQSEEIIIQKAEESINNNKFEEATALLSQLKTAENITRLKSIIQLKKYQVKLSKVDIFIKNKNYDLANQLLNDIKWEKISTDYDSELIEENFFKKFVKEKNDLIKTIPEDIQIALEEEYDF